MPAVSVSLTTSAYSDERYFFVRVDPTDRAYPSILIEGPLSGAEGDGEDNVEEKVRLFSLKLIQDAENVLKSYTKAQAREKHEGGKGKGARAPRQKLSSNSASPGQRRSQSKRVKR